MGYNVDNSFPTHPVVLDIKKELVCLNKNIKNIESSSGGTQPPTTSEMFSFYAFDILTDQEFTTIEVKKSPDCLSKVVVVTSSGEFELPSWIKSTKITLGIPFTLTEIIVDDEGSCSLETILITAINEQ